MTHPNSKPPRGAGQSGNAPPRSERDRSPRPSADRVQGEGNYDAARQFDEAERKFVESGKVDAAARAAAPRSEAEEREMLDAERKARSRAKEEDPAIRDRSRTANPEGRPARSRTRS